MSLRDELDQGMKDAMRSGDQVRKGTLRLAVSAIRLVELDQGTRLDDAETMAVLQKEIKLREEAISDAQRAGRPDLIAEREAETAVLKSFLPEQLSDDALTALAKEAIAESGATDLKQVGAVMNALMPKIKGRATGNRANQVVRSLLQEK